MVKGNETFAFQCRSVIFYINWRKSYFLGVLTAQCSLKKICISTAVVTLMT